MEMGSEMAIWIGFVVLEPREYPKRWTLLVPSRIRGPYFVENKQKLKDFVDHQSKIKYFCRNPGYADVMAHLKFKEGYSKQWV